MNKIITLILFLTAGTAFADQHVMFGRDWLKLDAGQKAMCLEGYVMGLFASEEVLRGELTIASLKFNGEPGDFSDQAHKLSTAVNVWLSRVANEETLVAIIDVWAQDHLDASIPEAIPVLVIHLLPMNLEKTKLRGPADGYNSIFKEAMKHAHTGR